MTIETIKVEGEGLSLARLVWRRFRRPMPGLVERTLAENPGLAGLGPYLPVGTVVRLPVPAEPSQQTVAPVRLWG